MMGDLQSCDLNYSVNYMALVQVTNTESATPHYHWGRRWHRWSMLSPDQEMFVSTRQFFRVM